MTDTNSTHDTIGDTVTDHQQIIDLTATYSWALDTRSWDDLDEVFLPDATADLVWALEGREAIKERVRTALEHLDSSQHLVATHQVRVDGDTAACRCYLQAQHVLGTDTYLVGGKYDDQLVRTEAGWRIAHRALTILWGTGNPAVMRSGR
jgi:hypothetical protein